MKSCSVAGCERRVVARGWCGMHYHRWQRTGSPLVVRPPGFAAKPRAACKVEDCARPSRRGSRGWCAKHYTRWLRHGDPTVDGNKQRRRRDVMDRIRAQVVITADDCWEWQGYCYPNGYGQIFVDGRNTYVHRAAWEAVNGPMPRGNHGHHTCHNRPCCNPDHVQSLTPREHASAHKEINA